MSTIRKWIKLKVENSTELTALVGTRVYPVLIPQNGIYPAIAYRVKEEPINIKGHISGMDIITVQFNIWAVEIGAAENISMALRSVFSTIENETLDGVMVQGTEWQESTDGVDEMNEYFFISSVFQLRYKFT